MKVSIIIPFYNRYDLVMRRMMEFHMYLNSPDIEILMVNNGSKPESIPEGNIHFWQKTVDKFSVRYLKWDNNIGFCGAMNRGAEKATGDILVFFSDDVMVFGDFLTPLLKMFEDDPTALIGGEMVGWAAGWNEFDINGGKTIVPYANGWMLACSSAAWKESGGFDTQYSPYDYEDVDLSTRWVEMGYNIKALNSRFLSHIGGATISGMDKNRLEQTKLNRQKYIMKWYERLCTIQRNLEKNGNA